LRYLPDPFFARGRALAFEAKLVVGRNRGLHPARSPELPFMLKSTESIYRYVYVEARSEVQRELAKKYLRRGYGHHKNQKRGTPSVQGQIPDMVLVDKRPLEGESRLIAGLYEADLTVEAGNRSAVGVIVERTTR